MKTNHGTELQILSCNQTLYMLLWFKQLQQNSLFKSGSETEPSEEHRLHLLDHLMSGTPDGLTQGLHQLQ